MKLKEKIAADHISAFKERDKVKAGVLSVIKADITSAEKSGKVMDDAAVTRLLTKAKKNLEESLSVREDSDLRIELGIIAAYLPEPMTEAEITEACKEILATMPEGLPENARQGKTMGEFTKRFPGRANPKDVMAIIKNL